MEEQPAGPPAPRRPGRRIDTDVLVVGAGPAGLVAAIALARYGVDVVLAEKRDGISTLSRALVVSTRVMELMRAWGLEDAVAAGAPGVEPRAWVTENLASGVGTEMPLGHPTAEEASRVSPSRSTWVPQDHHEPILLEHLRTLPSAVTRFRARVNGLRQDDGGVEASLEDLESGAVDTVRARYAIGADGAHSTVRKALGVALVGPDDLLEYHRVEFEAPLFDIVGDRRYGLYVITDPVAACVFAPRGLGPRWGLSREWTPGMPRLGDLSERELVEIIERGVGVSGLDVRIQEVTTFAFAAQIVDRYRWGRCFLAGDSAHRMTPRGGTGMNTAIQDAFDIGWKLAWVLRGWAPDSLLDSYDAERRPVGLHNVTRSGRPDGARSATDDALPWDLNGRLPHVWIDRPGGRVSTLDLIGPGLTLLASPREPRWGDRVPATACPLMTHVLDDGTAEALGIPVGGALLARPDAHEVCRWTGYDADWARHGLTRLAAAG